MSRYELQKLQGDHWRVLRRSDSFILLRKDAIEYSNGKPTEDLVIYDTKTEHSWPVYETLQVTVEEEQEIPEVLLRDSFYHSMFPPFLVIILGCYMLFQAPFGYSTLSSSILVAFWASYIISQFIPLSFLRKRLNSRKKKND